MNDLILKDRIIRWGGRATTRAAPGPAKQYGAAVNVSESQGRRHKSGYAYAPATRSLQLIDQLARNPHTSPWPIINAQVAVARRVQFEGQPTEQLEARLHELMGGEHARQAAQDASLQEAALTRSYSGATEPCLEHSDALLEISILTDEIAERMERGQ